MNDPLAPVVALFGAGFFTGLVVGVLAGMAAS